MRCSARPPPCQRDPGRDDDLPEELNRRVDRLLKIQEAKQALEEEARRAAAEKAAERAEAQDLDEQAKEAKVEAAAGRAASGRWRSRHRGPSLQESSSSPRRSSRSRRGVATATCRSCCRS